MNEYIRGEIVFCPCCGELPDHCEYVAEDYFVPPAKPCSQEEIECGNCYALIQCEVSRCGEYFTFYVED